MSNKTKEVGRSRLVVLGYTLIGAFAGGVMSVGAIYGCLIAAMSTLFIAALMLVGPGGTHWPKWFPYSFVKAVDMYWNGLGFLDSGVTEPISESQQLIVTLTVRAVVIVGLMIGALLGYKLSQRPMSKMPQSASEE